MLPPITTACRPAPTPIPAPILAPLRSACRSPAGARACPLVSRLLVGTCYAVDVAVALVVPAAAHHGGLGVLRPEQHDVGAASGGVPRRRPRPCPAAAVGPSLGGPGCRRSQCRPRPAARSPCAHGGGGRTACVRELS